MRLEIPLSKSADCFRTQNNTPMPPSSTGNGIHHPRFGYYLKERMDKLGIECVVKVKNDYDEKPAGQPGDDIVDFLAGHLQHPEGLCKPEDRFWQVRL